MHFDRLDESYAMVKSNVHFDKTTLTGTHSLANSGRQHMPPNSLAKLARQRTLLWTKIGMTGCTGLTGMHRPVRPVKVTLPKFRFDFTIA